MIKDILVVVKEPGQRAVQKRIPNTLAAFQHEVGGYIEAVPMFRSILAIVNEEGRLLNLPANFSGLCGTVVFCTEDGEDFAGLSHFDADALVQLLGK